VDKEYVKDNKYDNILLISGIIGFCLVGLLAGYSISEYVATFDDGKGLSKSRDAWGQFGDFLGGLLNPAIGALTVYLLLVSVYIQRKELRNSIAEMKSSNKSLVQQDVRQTFFTWLESYREIVGGVEGRDYLKKNFNTILSDRKLVAIFRDKIPVAELDHRLDQFLLYGIPPPEIKFELQQFMSKQWEELYKQEAHHIGSMFRTLFRLLRWIDEQDSEVLTPTQKYQYISIARAQLSDIEIDYLFFNGLTERGCNFAHLINKYAIFDNIVFSGKPNLQLMQDPNSQIFLSTAFDSSLAKLELKIINPAV
jgi:hypothetical protein